MIFTSESNTKQLAVIIPGPLAIILPEKGSFSAVFKIICFRFNKISNISSRIPGIVANSCAAPGILIAVIAAPSRFDKRTRRKAFPMVNP